jgi:outer membrane protein insertion porin family
MTRRTTFLIFTVISALAILYGSGRIFAQNVPMIREIVVLTNMENNPDINGYKQLVINQCGLRIGTPLSRENASNAIRLLWNLKIYSDIQIREEQVADGIRVVIDVDILPMVNSVVFEGFKEFKDDEILSAIKLTRGMMIGEWRVAEIQSVILNMYRNKGFLAATLEVRQTPLIADSTKVDVVIAVHEGKKVKVKVINIVGNEAMDDKKLKKVMKNTKEDRWYRSSDFKDEGYEQDKMAVIGLYKTEGYRDMEIVRDSTFVDPATEKMVLTIFINEGPQYYFGETSFEGNTVFTSDELKTAIRYAKGDIFNEQELGLSIYGYPEQEIKGINTLYNDRGYLKMSINPVQTVHGDTIDVFIDIAEGNVSNISRILINGNNKTIEKVIRREINLDPGQPFNRTTLDRSRRDVLALNYFQDVQYDYLLHEDDEDVDLKFTIKEKQTGMASMGAGYSERDRLVGTLSFTNQNLFGRGQSINFNWEMGTRRRAFQIGFGEPWLFDTQTSFSFDIYNIIRNDYTTAFDEERRKGASLRLGRDLRKWIDYTRGYVTYRLEDVDYTNASSYYNEYLMIGKTSSLSLTMTRDSRDMPQFASQGARTSLVLELAGGPLGGDLSYYKYLLTNEMYTPLFWKTSLVIRTNIGYLKGYQESTYVPYSERFMPGGTSWDGIVRGYPNRQVCPLLDGEEIGGETMMVNNIEFQVPVVAQTVYGIVFYDFGNAWRNLSETNPFDSKRSVGIGARVNVPGIGNLGFDVGYGFDKLEGSDEVGGLRTHFQFGQMY